MALTQLGFSSSPNQHQFRSLLDLGKQLTKATKLSEGNLKMKCTTKDHKVYAYMHSICMVLINTPNHMGWSLFMYWNMKTQTVSSEFMTSHKNESNFKPISWINKDSEKILP